MFTLIRIFWNRHLNVARKAKHNRITMKAPLICFHCGADIEHTPYVAKAHGYIETFCDSTCHGLWGTQMESAYFAEWVDGRI